MAERPLRRVWFATSGGLLGATTAFYGLCLAVGTGILVGGLSNTFAGGAVVGMTYLVGFLTGAGSVLVGHGDGLDGHRRRLVTFLALFAGAAVVSPGELLTATMPYSPVGWPHVALTLATLLGGYAVGYRRFVSPRARPHVSGG
jgi:hypothetical protein